MPKILLVANRGDHHELSAALRGGDDDALADAALIHEIGDDATLARFIDVRPEVVVVSAMLEDGDARALISAMRDAVLPDRPFVVLVGDVDGPLRTALDALGAGIDRFVQRPLAAKALRFAVASGLAHVASIAARPAVSVMPAGAPTLRPVREPAPLPPPEPPPLPPADTYPGAVPLAPPDLRARWAALADELGGDLDEEEGLDRVVVAVEDLPTGRTRVIPTEPMLPVVPPAVSLARTPMPAFATEPMMPVVSLSALRDERRDVARDAAEPPAQSIEAEPIEAKAAGADVAVLDQPPRESTLELPAIAMPASAPAPMARVLPPGVRAMPPPPPRATSPGMPRVAMPSKALDDLDALDADRFDPLDELDELDDVVDEGAIFDEEPIGPLGSRANRAPAGPSLASPSLASPSDTGPSATSLSAIDSGSWRPAESESSEGESAESESSESTSSESTSSENEPSASTPSPNAPAVDTWRPGSTEIPTLDPVERFEAPPAPVAAAWREAALPLLPPREPTLVLTEAAQEEAAGERVAEVGLLAQASELMAPVAVRLRETGPRAMGLEELDEEGFDEDVAAGIDDDLSVDLTRERDASVTPPPQAPGPPPGGDFARELRKKMSLMAERLFRGADLPAAPVSIGPAHDHHTEIDLGGLVDEDAVDLAAATFVGAEDRLTDPHGQREGRDTRGAEGGELQRGVADAPALIARMFAADFTGRVVFRHRDAEKVVHFEAGRPVFASSNLVRDRMGELLVREGKISREQHDRCQDLVRDTGRRMGEILVDRGYLKRRELLPAVRRHVEDILYSLFAWDAGEYRMVAGDGATSERIRLSRHPAAMVLEGVRRKLDRATLERLVGAPSTIIEVTDRDKLAATIGVADLSAEERAALAALDGTAELAAVARHAGLSVAGLYPLVWSLQLLGLASARRRPGDDDGDAPALVGESDLAIDRDRVRARAALVADADYFSLLGVRRDATGFEIKRAYEAARRDFAAEGFPVELRRELEHELDEIAEVLDEAYRVLRDDGLRGAYRAHLREPHEAA